MAGRLRGNKATIGQASSSATAGLAEIKLWAEYRMGEELAGLEKHGGARPAKGGGRPAKPRSHSVTSSRAAKLKELGVEEMQSSRWQGVYSLTAPAAARVHRRDAGGAG